LEKFDKHYFFSSVVDQLKKENVSIHELVSFYAKQEAEHVMLEIADVKHAGIYSVYGEKFEIERYKNSLNLPNRYRLNENSKSFKNYDDLLKYLTLVKEKYGNKVANSPLKESMMGGVPIELHLIPENFSLVKPEKTEATCFVCEHSFKPFLYFEVVVHAFEGQHHLCHQCTEKYVPDSLTSIIKQPDSAFAKTFFDTVDKLLHGDILTKMIEGTQDLSFLRYFDNQWVVESTSREKESIQPFDAYRLIENHIQKKVVDN
jgi:hypothetical protein